MAEPKAAQNRALTMDLVNGSVAKTLFFFSVPFMLSTLLQTLYSTVDTIIVGQFLGSEGLAAVANGSQLMQLVYMICIGFASAGQTLIAQAKGAEAYDKLQKIVGTLFVLETALSVAAGLICLVFSGRILTLLHTAPEAYVQARYYIVICSAGIVFTGLYNMFSAVLRGMGDSKHPLLFVVIATAVNVVLDILFVAVFRMNVAGAALATIIGQAVSVIFSILFLVRHSADFGLRFDLRSLHFDRELGGKITALGIPMGLSGAAIQISFLFVYSMVNQLGVAVSAAFGVMQKIRSIPGFINQGFGLGAASMIGQNLGARKPERINRIVRYCIFFSVAVDAVFCVLYLTVPVLLFRLFTQDAAVLAFAGMALTVLACELPAQCVMPACNALVSAQGFIQLSIPVAIVDAFAGRVLLCWLFGIRMGMGALGFFAGNAAGTYITAIVVFVYYVSGLWRRRGVLI